MFFVVEHRLSNHLFHQNCVRFQSVELFVTLHDWKSLTWGFKNKVKVDLQTRSTNVMSAEIEGAFSTASKIKIEYTDKDILCLEKLQLKAMDNTTTFDLIQVTKMITTK